VNSLEPEPGSSPYRIALWDQSQPVDVGLSSCFLLPNCPHWLLLVLASYVELGFAQHQGSSLLLNFGFVVALVEVWKGLIEIRLKN